MKRPTRRAGTLRKQIAGGDSPLAGVMERLGLTQDELALVAGVSQPLLSNVLRGLAPASDRLLGYLEGCGVDVRAFEAEQLSVVERTRARLDAAARGRMKP